MLDSFKFPTMGEIKGAVPGVLKTAGPALLKAALSKTINHFNINIPLYYGCIYNKLTDTMITFRLPENVTRSAGNSLTELTAETRSITMPYYNGGSSPTLSFSVDLDDDLYNTVIKKGMFQLPPNTGAAILKTLGFIQGNTINEMLSAFRALTYPEYVGGVAVPPECLIYLGSSSCYLARCTSINDTMQGLTGLNHELEFTYRNANISLNFTILKEVSVRGGSQVPSASDIQDSRLGLVGMLSSMVVD